MNRNFKKPVYILYKYEPVFSNYFEQTDVIQLDPSTEKTAVNLDTFYERACAKNSCSMDEIRIIEIFEDKKLLDHYLRQSNDAYLIYSVT